MAGGASDSKDSRWYLTVEQLQNSPSRKTGIDTDQELNHRQLAAYLIQDMGQRLRVSQLCINTAIVYMHRFYAFHSFTHFHRNGIAAASLFLAAKVEEQPRKLETVIQIAHASLNIEFPDPTKECYQEQAQDLVFNENVLLQTLGFDVAVDHPHTHVVKTCHLVKACKDLAQTSYFLASNSLHLTTMCLQYRPTVVACFCIYLACKWSRWEIPQSTEGKFWFHYVDKTVTVELLEQLTNEFLVIYEKSPARLKSKLNSIKAFSKSVELQRPLSQPSSSSSSRSQHTASGEHSRSSSHSSHHRSNHHHKQSAITNLGDHLTAKTSTQISHKPQHQASSSSSSTRARPERTDRPLLVQEPHFPALHRTAGSTGILPPLTRGNISDNPPTISSSANSAPQQRSNDPNYQISINKSRNIINPPHTQPIVQDSHRHPIKQDQRHSMKEIKSTDSAKPLIKGQQPVVVNNSYTSSSGENSRIPSNSSSRPPYQQPPNYNQAIASRNNQHDHSSVHIQKQSLNESSFRLPDELGRVNEPMDISSPPKQTKAPSIFSPDWNDKSSSIPITNTNNKNNNTVGINNGLIVKPSRDSPKKHEKRSETPKKDKRMEPPVTPYNQKITSSEKRTNSAKRLTDTPGMPTMSISSPISPLDSNSSNKNANISMKRSHPDDAIKQEDGIDFRESKLRKHDIQPLSPLRMHDIKPIASSLNVISSNSFETQLKPPSSYNALNGIETNPDLVSSLLKESLCNDSKFPSFSSNVSSGVQQLQQQPQIKTESIKREAIDLPIIPEIVDTIINLPPQIKLDPNIEQEQRVKSEKKKKKEKHKHKEKDKSKDREERKKHKKDKDRQKDKEKIHDTISAGMHNPIKITIPKEKLNLPPEDANQSTSGFKITIPKDRIKTEVPPPPPTSLKIKISKDMIENYNTSSSHHATDNHTVHSHSNKKKDKDRDRDKDREREKSKSARNFEYNKQNGNGSNGSNSGNNNGVGVAAGSNSTNRNTSSKTKVLPHYNNHSQYMQHPQYMQQNQYNVVPPTQITNSTANQLSSSNLQADILYSNHTFGNTNYYQHSGNTKQNSNNMSNKKN